MASGGGSHHLHAKHPVAERAPVRLHASVRRDRETRVGDTSRERGKNNSQNTGDPACANGWAFSADHLPGGSRPDHATDITKIERWFAEAGADVFACAHTCRPVLQRFHGGVVANNGAAGLGWLISRGPARPRDARGLARTCRGVRCADVESALGRWRGAPEIRSPRSVRCGPRPRARRGRAAGL